MRAWHQAIGHALPAQAIDIVHPWTLDAAGKPLLPITTFSIAMIHRCVGVHADMVLWGGCGRQVSPLLPWSTWGFCFYMQCLHTTYSKGLAPIPLLS